MNTYIVTPIVGAGYPAPKPQKIEAATERALMAALRCRLDFNATGGAVTDPDAHPRDYYTWRRE